jgi:nitrogen fixation NifU-like protein
MAYSDKVIDHYNNPRNVGQMDKASTEVGTGLVGAPECGDVMRLQIRVNPETNVIEDAKFNLRLRIGYCFVLARHRVGEGQDDR